MDKLAAMQTFVAVADAGSLTGGARALGKALPTVVRSLSLLEGSLGTRLVQRSTRRMSLTAAGNRYLERCRKILAEVAEAEDDLGEEAAELRGTIRVTAPVLYGQLHVAPAVHAFLEQHRGVRVELLLLDRVVDLVEEGFDLGVRIARLRDSSLVSRKVCEVRSLVVAAPEARRRWGTPSHPRELAQLPVVAFASGDIPPSWSFVDGGQRLQVRVSGVLACNHAPAAIDACRRGLGFGRFLSYQVQTALDARELERVLTEYEPPPLPVQVVFPSSRLLSARTRALVDWLKGQLSAPSRPDAGLTPLAAAPVAKRTKADRKRR